MEPLIRYSEPNQYDQMPYGTKIVVKRNECVIDTYIQTSQDESNPVWKLVEDSPEESK